MRLFYSLLFFTLLFSNNTLLAQICPEFAENNLTIVTPDCTGAAVCTSLDFNSVEHYDIELNGNFYSGTTSPCGVNTTVQYDVLGIGNYPVNINSWEVNGIIYQNIICDSPGALTDTMNFINPGGNWMFDANDFKISSTTSTDSLGWLILTEINTGLMAEIIPQYNSTPTNTSFEFPVGNHVFIVRDIANECDDTLFVEVICQPEPDSIAVTINIGDTDTLFLDTSTIPNINDFYNDCTSQSGTAVNFEVVDQLYWVYYEGLEVGTEQACIVFCNASGQCDTTYISVTVEAVVNCVDPEIVFAGLMDATCDELGSIALEMSDNSEELNFFWSGGLPNAAEVEGLLPGNYMVTVTYVNPDFAACSTVGEFLVAQIDSLDFFLENTTPASCSEQGTALFSNPSYVYEWSDGGSGDQRDDLAAGTYVVTVSDASGICSSVSQTIVIEQTSSFSIQANVANQCDTLGSVYLQNINGAVFPVTYNWFDLPGTDNDASRPELAPGTYTLEVTDANGCVATETYTIVDDCPGNCIDPEIANIQTTNATCETFGSILIEMADSADYTFDWSPDLPDSNTQINLIPGEYMVTIFYTDSLQFNCSTVQSFTILNTDSLDYQLVSTTPAGCDNTGTATFSNPDYVYFWSDGGQGAERNDLAAGSYSVTVTLPNGNCEEVTFVNIQSGALEVTAAISNITCDSLGSINLTVFGGTLPYTYQWEDDPNINTPDRQIQSAGIFAVTITDAAGCTASLSNLLVNDDCNNSCEDPELVSVQITDPTCEITGTIQIEMDDNAAYEYNWSHNGPNSTIQSGLSPGNYQVTITRTDTLQGFCFTTENFTLVNSDSLSYSLFGTTPAGCSENGTATFDNLDYTYLWPDGVEGIERDGLAAGNYVVTVTDGNGLCTDITIVTIQGSNILLNAQVANVCDTLGSIYTFVTGGSFPYTYQWSDDPFNVSSAREGLNVGTYTVVVTDGEGCIAEETFQIVDDCNGPGEISFTSIPNDENITCGDTAAFVEPTAVSTCPGEIMIDFTETAEFICGGSRTITRRWVATDDCGNAAVAEQVITEMDFAAPTISMMDSIITVDLLNGDTIPAALSLVTVTDACGGPVNLDFVKEETITDDGYEVAYTYIATDGCGNQSTTVIIVNIIGGIVWPGDTDSSGVVNNEDLFNVGFAHGLTGPSRINPTTDFLPQYASPWAENGLDDVNFRHADTDGNGVVNDQDILAINLNYNLTHNLQEQQGDTRESFEVDFELDQITADDWVHVDILLANGAAIADFYGAAFIIEYDASLVKENTAHIDFNDSWVGSFFDDFVALQKDFYDEGQLDVGIVRTNQQGIDGSGKIGSFRFQLKQGIPFSNFTLTAREGSGVRSDRSGYEIENAEVVITGTQELLPADLIGVYPNPVTTELFVEIPSRLTVKSIVLYGVNGQQVSAYEATAADPLDVSQLAAGIYSLRIITDQGVWTNRVSILR